jgi:hypothetical protein
MLRLGEPALVYLLLIDPVGDFLGSRASLVQLLVEVRGSRDLGSMWFVVVLFVFLLAYAGWRNEPRKDAPHERSAVVSSATSPGRSTAASTATDTALTA